MPRGSVLRVKTTAIQMAVTSTKKRLLVTVWKFQKLSVKQILREINFRDFRGPKTAILTHLKALNLDFS